MWIVRFIHGGLLCPKQVRLQVALYGTLSGLSGRVFDFVLLACFDIMRGGGGMERMWC